ncbi:MAG TPA: complex I NDUFA9 subunit family protein [Sphingomicrobium sp.]|nr:complex I NDUFA9 subunit family protein [Sphingomicrobium sp.]
MQPETFRLVTLFGGGGFLGRYVAQALYKTGARVRVAQFDARKAFFLKPLGGLGQTQFVAADIRNPAQVREAIKGSDAVVNLVGILKGNFEQIHIDGAANVAEACAVEGIQSLVHISAIGADPDSPSRYGSSKGLGEQAVRAAVPSATIVRPSILFGREDNFINRFASMTRLSPVIPVIRGNVKFQPVYAADVGKAVTAAALHPRDHAAKIYELGGPQVLSMRELMEWIDQTTGWNRALVEIPDSVGRLLARGLGWLPGAPITWDQWLMLQRDNVVSPGAEGLRSFGIAPTPLAAVSEGWLTSYRRGGRFAAKQPY